MKRFVTEKPKFFITPFLSIEEMVQAWDRGVSVYLCASESEITCAPPFTPDDLLNFRKYGTKQTPNYEPATLYITYTDGSYLPYTTTFDKEKHKNLLAGLFDCSYYAQELEGWFVDEPDEKTEGATPKSASTITKELNKQFRASGAAVGISIEPDEVDAENFEEEPPQPDHNFRVGDKVQCESGPYGYPRWDFLRDRGGLKRFKKGIVIAYRERHKFQNAIGPAIGVKFGEEDTLTWWFPLPGHPLYAPNRPGWPEKIEDE